jgi:hypothetical protein
MKTKTYWEGQGFGAEKKKVIVPIDGFELRELFQMKQN